jgi:hypothetical protein
VKRAFVVVRALERELEAQLPARAISTGPLSTATDIFCWNAEQCITVGQAKVALGSKDPTLLNHLANAADG